ncbi:hypothetical protein FKW77_001982 [Venturia effusa]|uniref:Uncharacterized protein n=1 Tax=Venturia effusa TaxID=50376 RepID=A0A517L6Q9_9PEZI|nr:hypothetical protein FKW77_001982 [Venturia effusa]
MTDSPSPTQYLVSLSPDDPSHQQELYRNNSFENQEDDDPNGHPYRECYDTDGRYGKIDHEIANADTPWTESDNKALALIEDRIKDRIENETCTLSGVYAIEDIEKRLADRWSKMKSRLDRNLESQEVVQSMKKFNRYYSTEREDQETLYCRNNKEKQAPLSLSKHLSLGLNTKDKMLCSMKTYSKNEDAKGSSVTCSSGIISSPNGLILGAFDNHARFDGNRWLTEHEAQPAEVRQRQALNQSELVFHQLMSHFNQDKDEVGKLSVIWRADITNWITKRTILKAHKATNITGLCWGKFTENPNDEIECKQFQNLIATENGSVGMWLLTDHPDVFKSQITEVYTFPMGSLPGVEFFHMVFRLGPRGA